MPAQTDATVLDPAQGEGRAPVNAQVTHGVGCAVGGMPDGRVFVEEFCGIRDGGQDGACF